MYKYCTIAFFLLLSGCDVKPFAQNIIQQSVQSQEVNDVKSAMSNLSVDECKILYKQYAGLAEFMENTDKIQNTIELETVVDNFQKTYKYEITDKKWLDFIDKWLESRKWESKTIVDTVRDETKEISRSQIISDFRILAEAAKLNLEHKDVGK